VNRGEAQEKFIKNKQKKKGKNNPRRGWNLRPRVGKGFGPTKRGLNQKYTPPARAAWDVKEIRFLVKSHRRSSQK